MDRRQKPTTFAQALPARNAWLGRARDRTADLRARLLTGDTEAAQVTRGTFHLLYWEHRGRQILPLRNDQGNPRRSDS